MPPPLEMVDVVDDADVVIGTVARAVMRRGGFLHRVAFVIVRATDGGVLIHRRSDAKDLWPGRWDLAVGGVVTAGESYETAARRELAEEIGLSGAEPVAIGGGRFDDDDVRLLGRVYEVVSDGPFVFADGEVMEARFVTVAELERFLGCESFVPDSVALVLPLLSGAAPTGHTPVRHTDDQGDAP